MVASYELVREIPNSCSGNQMRDVFFSEIETDNPEAYVRAMFPGQAVQYEVEQLRDGALCVFAENAGLIQKFLFTPLDEE